MKTITSRDNPTYRDALKLLRRKHRRESGMYLVEGVKPVRDAIETGASVERIFLCERQLQAQEREGQLPVPESSAETVMLPVPESSAETVVLPEELFRRLSDTEHSQGMIAQVRMGALTPAEFFKACRKDGIDDAAGYKNILVLDRIQDPGNAGTMIRTAEAAGFCGVVAMKGTVDIYSPKVVRSAAGSLFRMPMLTAVGEEEVLGELRSGGWQIAVTTADDGSDCFSFETNASVALFIGNEGRGIGESIIDAADIRLMIPMEGSIESLNAAVAAGILMYRLRK